MGKKEKLICELTPLLNNIEELENYLIENCDLPGPRANLELVFALAEIFFNKKALNNWLKISSDIAGANDPQSFLPMCAIVCLGKFYTKSPNDEILKLIKNSSSDSRWRIRESAAFAFQLIGENNFNELERIFNEWYSSTSSIEKRAILVALAHPKFLNESIAGYALDLTDKVLKEFNPDQEILKKALDFVISVYTVYNPAKGFNLMDKWIGVNKIFSSIIRSNLKKKRLLKSFPDEVQRHQDKLLLTNDNN